jgi:hypothetical protein
MITRDVAEPCQETCVWRFTDPPWRASGADPSSISCLAIIGPCRFSVTGSGILFFMVDEVGLCIIFLNKLCKMKRYPPYYGTIYGASRKINTVTIEMVTPLRGLK